MIIDIVKVLLPSVIAFAFGVLMTPFWTAYLYKHEMWKKKAKTVSLDGGGTPIFQSLHAHKEVGTPRLGGVIIWASVLVTAIVLWLLAYLFPSGVFGRLDFISRDQTWIPLATLLIGALVGMVDDLLDIRGSGGHIAGGLSLRKRLLIVAMVSFLVALWFYLKLDANTINLPFDGALYLGWLYIPLFMIVAIGIYSGGVIDGLDGLAGGLFATMFAAYGSIAFVQQQYNLAALCVTIVGAILAFLWFNIPPARFYMSETGSMALTLVLSIVAFMTDYSFGEGHGVLVLPIIALPLMVTALSVAVQILSKKFRNGKKVFKVAPLHHHFEAIGWPAYKVTMRYWIVGVICAVFGVVLALVG